MLLLHILLDSAASPSAQPTSWLGFAALVTYLFIKDAGIPWFRQRRNGGQPKTDSVAFSLTLENLRAELVKFGGDLSDTRDKMGELDTEIKLLKQELVGMDRQSGLLGSMRDLYATVDQLRKRQDTILSRLPRGGS